MKTFLKTTVLLLIITLSLLLAAFIWFNRGTGVIYGKSTEFEIVKGDNSRTVAQRLYDNKYINSRLLFVVISRVFRLDTSLKTGWIELKPGSSTVDIMRAIYGGSFVTVSFTVPEGSTLSQIKEILLVNNVVTEKELDEFLSDPSYVTRIGLPSGFKTAEGFLFPETYKFFKGVNVGSILNKMVKLFYEKLAEIYPDSKNLDEKELYKKIIMASIIEKEVKLIDESSIVAGVFYNRLNIGMRLQSCATIQYLLGKPKEQLLESDLYFESPYNTYMNKGLPPSPICNPGYISIRSSFYPQKNTYLFFVVKNPVEGSHHFSSTYEEHLNAQKMYKRIKGFY